MFFFGKCFHTGLHLEEGARSTPLLGLHFLLLILFSNDIKVVRRKKTWQRLEWSEFYYMLLCLPRALHFTESYKQTPTLSRGIFSLKSVLFLFKHIY